MHWHIATVVPKKVEMLRSPQGVKHLFVMLPPLQYFGCQYVQI